MSLADFAKEGVFNKYDMLRGILHDTQHFRTNCAVQSLKLHLETILGRDINQDTFTALANKMGFWKPGGTDLSAMQKFAEELGIKSSLNPINDISELNPGSQYQIGLDPKEIAENTLKELSSEQGHSYTIESLGDGRYKLFDPSSPTGEPIIREAGVIRNAMEHGKEVLEFKQPEVQNLQKINNTLNEKTNAISPNDYIPIEQDLDPKVINYADQGSLGSDLNLEVIPQEVKNGIFEINLDIENIIATGGYIGLMQYLNKNPKIQKKVTKVALAIGALDSVIDINDNQVSLDLEHIELSPLLIASLAYYISQIASNSKNIKIQKLSIGFNTVLSKSMNVIKYAGYGAIGLETIDLLFDIGVTDLFAELIDKSDILDLFGNAADGADVMDGLLNFGIGIVLARIIKGLFQEMNEEKIKKVKRLERKIVPKKTLAKLLEMDAPVTLLIGPYIETIRETGFLKCL